MNNRNFMQMIEKKFDQGKHLCVGLDTDYAQMPESVKDGGDLYEAVLNFNSEIMRATADYACAFKPNSAFYEGMGEDGTRALNATVAVAAALYPDIPMILDAKRADIGNTNKHYAKSAFDLNAADALTVHPYLGKEAMGAFLDKKDKGLFVLCKTSNPGSGEFQNLIVEGGDPLYVHVARNVANEWNAKNRNCGLVVGATYPAELARVREVAPDVYILAPGVGTQGGDLQALMKVEMQSGPNRLIINSSSGIIYASKKDDFAEIARAKAEELHKQILSAS